MRSIFLPDVYIHCANPVDFGEKKDSNQYISNDIKFFKTHTVSLSLSLYIYIYIFKKKTKDRLIHDNKFISIPYFQFLV